VQGLLVTATDTDVGKTVLSASLIAAMAAAGERVRAHKPVVTGLAERGGGHEQWPADHELLGAAAGMSPEEVAPLRFGPAASPHLAAELAGVPIDRRRLLAAARAAGDGATLVIEGVGGLLVPLAADFTVCDLARELGLPVLIAARAGLGTINHTLLTLRGARAAGLDVRAVVFTPWPARPSAIERSNRETIERLGEIEVAGLPAIERPIVAELARAGAALPWRRWLDKRPGPARKGHARPEPDRPLPAVPVPRPARQAVRDTHRRRQQIHVPDREAHRQAAPETQASGATATRGPTREHEKGC
jgi:dethiobiotin synthetase